MDNIICPTCGQQQKLYRNPVPTVDVIIETASGIILIERKNPPPGWALPGGFVDYGESLENAAIREAKEETGLSVKLQYHLGAYSDPQRDKRLHTISYVFVATATGVPKAGDDAKSLEIFTPENIPALAFDHEKIIKDYIEAKNVCSVR